ncbi:hypothetical protein D9M69_455800 [compost metagenome]
MHEEFVVVVGHEHLLLANQLEVKAVQLTFPHSQFIEEVGATGHGHRVVVTEIRSQTHATLPLVVGPDLVAAILLEVHHHVGQRLLPDTSRRADVRAQATLEKLGRFFGFLVIGRLRVVLQLMSHDAIA